MAYLNCCFRLDILLLSVFTTITLQVLSNFANDYGDSQHGADMPSSNRKGPSRAVQSGVISPKQMLRAVITLAVLAFIAGLFLLFHAFGHDLTYWLWFLGIGVLSIIAAITYTMGLKPYGYAGLGDLAVFIFFGMVGVLGSFFLYSKSFDERTLYVSGYIGFLSVMVLNLNNMRDIESDRLAGKFSIPVRLGIRYAMVYHILLMLGTIACLSILILSLPLDNWKLIVLALPTAAVTILTRGAIMKVSKGQSSQLFDKFLPITAISGALTVLLIVIMLSITPDVITCP
jgi:1,4-dihydroxy-2-naphthoate octaprenyltransferase